MRRTQGRTDTALRTLKPSAKHIQKPQPITREELKAASQRLTPEECRVIMSRAMKEGRAWIAGGVDSRCGDLQGGKG
jgi:hypothetical protein